MSNPTSSRWLLPAALPAVALLSPAAVAYPEGAPWGSANPAAVENCGSCHYDYEPVADSASLVLDGLPDAVVAGECYELTIRFEARDARVSGFQIVADAGESPAGRFESERDDIESTGGASRSTRPRSAADGFVWPLRWLAPGEAADVIFHVAASSANDDQSPFGDTIHYRQIDVAVLPRPED